MAGSTFVSISLLPEGMHPGLPALTPDEQLLIVPNQDTDNVSVIETRTLSVRNVIPLRKQAVPWEAAVMPGGRFAWVTNSQFQETEAQSTREESSVSVIDLKAGELVGEIAVGAGPNGICFDASGEFAYVTNQRSDTISVIAVKRREVVDSIETGRAPAMVRLSEDGRLLVVSNFADASLSVIDVATRKVRRTIPVGDGSLSEPDPRWGPGDTVGVAIDGNSRVYATNWRSNTVVTANLRTGKVIATHHTIPNPFGVEVDRKNRLLIVASSVDRRLVTLDLERRHVVDNLRFDGLTQPGGGGDGGTNYWLNDPDQHRIIAFLPQGIKAIVDLPNMVARPL
jgi:YVTN family beta-propeller protein